MVSLNTQNLLGGLDELLHGGNLHGWGAIRSQDNTLLYARGFDPVSNKYLYEVNERFGASRQGANGINIPFQVGVNARLMVGPDRARDAIDAVRRGIRRACVVEAVARVARASPAWRRRSRTSIRSCRS